MTNGYGGVSPPAALHSLIWPALRSSALSPELLSMMESKFLFAGLGLIPRSPSSPTSLLPYYWFVLETLPNTLFSHDSLP